MLLTSPVDDKTMFQQIELKGTGLDSDFIKVVTVKPWCNICKFETFRNGVSQGYPTTTDIEGGRMEWRRLMKNGWNR